MTQSPFIFSNAPKWVILRHGSFWLAWYLFQTILYSFSPAPPPLLQLPWLVRLATAGVEGSIFLLPHIFFSYTLMYWVIPRFIIRKKYLPAVLLTLVLVLITAALSALLTATIIDTLRNGCLRIFTQSVIPIAAPSASIQFGIAMLSGLRGSLTIGGLASAIKLMKYWYEKEQRATIAEKEKAVTELQMLKAQLHPHFLFNTLNNIYSFTRNVSAPASSMIFTLSGLLRYILYDCKEPLVPLHREIDMLMEYVSLEKVRYNKNQLEFTAHLPADTQGYVITPLLLLPFIENAFKHGASNLIEHPWIHLQISITNHQLQMILTNNKPAGGSPAHAGGIGIENVRKRLKILYPGKHQLTVLNEEEVFIVNLQLELDKQPVTVNASPVAYATTSYA